MVFMGCEESVEKPSGFHFQGTDCMKCHNVDLAESSHQTFGGSMFLVPGANNDDLTNSCNQDLYMELKRADGTVAFDSRVTTKSTDSGFKALGNIFTLKRDGEIPIGVYQVRILSADGSEVAQSSSTPTHTFSGNYKTVENDNDSNRYSCNACHGVSTSQLFPNTDASLCRK